jgi:periplasmic protein CpxP/Spy
MTRFKNVLLGVIGAFLFAAVPLTHAQEAPGTDGAQQVRHSGQRFQEIYSQLNLTDAQKKQLEANKKQHRVKMENARQEVKTDREALHAELMAPQLDMPKITALHDRIKDLQSQMEDIKLSSVLAVRAILTPEQFTKFVNLMHKHKQERDQ